MYYSTYVLKPFLTSIQLRKHLQHLSSLVREVDTERESKLPSFTIIENRSSPAETQQLSADASSAMYPLRHNVQTCSSY